MKTLSPDDIVAIIRKSRYFNARWYKNKYQDVKRAKIDPAAHYAHHGWKEQRDPSSRFSTLDYLNQYKDVRTLGVNPLLHYELYGKKENRTPKIKSSGGIILKLLQFSITNVFSDIRSWICSVYFNFHYLPFRQARRLPILLHKPRFAKLDGTVRIEGTVRKGMIKLGYHMNTLYPDTGIVIENHGGEIVFKGRVTIGGAAAISVGPLGRLRLEGENVSVAGLKLVCYNDIHIHEYVRLGWEVLVMDTGFHRLKNLDGTFATKGSAPIALGHHTWVSTRSMVMPGVVTAPHTIVAANSMLNKKYTESHVLLAGAPAVVKRRGIWRDFSDDAIDYADCK